jgi:hypothetical protein
VRRHRAQVALGRHRRQALARLEHLLCPSVAGLSRVPDVGDLPLQEGAERPAHDSALTREKAIARVQLCLDFDVPLVVRTRRPSLRGRGFPALKQGPAAVLGCVGRGPGRPMNGVRCVSACASPPPPYPRARRSFRCWMTLTWRCEQAPCASLTRFLAARAPPALPLAYLQCHASATAMTWWWTQWCTPAWLPCSAAGGQPPRPLSGASSPG